MDESIYDDIRPFRDAEVGDAIESLCANPEFRQVMARFSFLDLDQLASKAHEYKKIVDFQRDWEQPLLEWLVKHNSAGLTTTGIENVSERGQLFLTNHRDITIDPAYLNLSIMRTFDHTCEIAIGDNLFARPWIRDVVRLSRSFTVHRNLTRAEMVRDFIQLSGYIRHTINDYSYSVWMAQREGRSKDSTDLTQESLIKMLSLSGEGSFIERLQGLDIHPTTLSYEYDPCDYLKAAEFQLRRDNPDYKKSAQDDVQSMSVGITENHGRINVHFGASINDELQKIADSIEQKRLQAEAVCQLCNRVIHSNYVIYPINEWAYEERFGERRFRTEHPEEYENYIAGQIAKVEIPNKDEAFLRAKLIEMYSNPLISKLKTIK